jgi:RNA polymerase sigma-70 factor (ECF subfamily)
LKRYRKAAKTPRKINKNPCAFAPLRLCVSLLSEFCGIAKKVSPMSQQIKYPNDPEQAEWIFLTKQGDQAAFGNLVEKYQRPVYNLCYQMLNDADEAEDATQEVFLRAYAKLDTYDEQRQFSTWLFAIASHYCLDKLKSPRLPLVSWDSLSDFRADHNPAQPEKILLETETTQEVRALLETLKPDYRAAVVLKYWYTLSYQEIAQALDTTVSAIKSRLFYARKKMAQTAIQQQRVVIGSSQLMPVTG